MLQKEEEKKKEAGMDLQHSTTEPPSVICLLALSVEIEEFQRQFLSTPTPSLSLSHTLDHVGRLLSFVHSFIGSLPLDGYIWSAMFDATSSLTFMIPGIPSGVYTIGVRNPAGVTITETT